jgi:hypothetical protein
MLRDNAYICIWQALRPHSTVDHHRVTVSLSVMTSFISLSLLAQGKTMLSSNIAQWESECVTFGQPLIFWTLCFSTPYRWKESPVFGGVNGRGPVWRVSPVATGYSKAVPFVLGSLSPLLVALLLPEWKSWWCSYRWCRTLEGVQIQLKIRPNGKFFGSPWFFCSVEGSGCVLFRAVGKLL